MCKMSPYTMNIFCINHNLTNKPEEFKNAGISVFMNVCRLIVLTAYAHDRLNQSSLNTVL